MFWNNCLTVSFLQFRVINKNYFYIFLNYFFIFFKLFFLLDPRKLFGLVNWTALLLDNSNTFFISFEFIFVRTPNASYLFLFVTALPYHQRFTPLRFLESFIVNSQQAILGTNLGKNNRFSTLNQWTRIVISTQEWNICTRKHICRFISSLFGPCVKLNKGIKQKTLGSFVSKKHVQNKCYILNFYWDIEGFVLNKNMWC